MNNIPHSTEQHPSLDDQVQQHRVPGNVRHSPLQQSIQTAPLSSSYTQWQPEYSAHHQGEAETNSKQRSESSPSSEEYLIERSTFDEEPDNGSFPNGTGEAMPIMPVQLHQDVSLATSDVPPELPPSNEGDDLTKSSQPSIHPGNMAENRLSAEESERGGKRKCEAEGASERSQPQRHTKRRQDSAVSSPSGSTSSTSAQGNIQKKERKIYTLTESVGDNFRYQRVPRPENQGGGFTESYQSSTNPEGRFTSAEHRPQEPSTESKRKREEEVASETSQHERPVKRICNSSASSASSSSPHSSSPSPPMPSQEAVPEENNMKRKKKLLRDKMYGPFWLQRIPEQEKELIHIAETVSPGLQIPESEESENY
ncbi:hypothetical protein CPB84DRAFT_1767978 [Gymnopilus junonius]|uniref:Uncharacterized protein n=1 Tax=Gymnopilus junonius TaxID=109634 RepID=A0A9P5TR35_GYMJU|nr:hypothetical protein CPB84DRAFT_1767978 [Gymnopilus junonius]